MSEAAWQQWRANFEAYKARKEAHRKAMEDGDSEKRN